MPVRTGQKQKMLAGERYFADDPELVAAHLRAQELSARYNASAAGSQAERRSLLTDLFGYFGEDAVLRSPFRCDYGFNVRIGARTFINFDCTFLDCMPIVIGEEVQIGPGVHLYTALHPLEAAARRAGVEYSAPVSIGDGVWLGGRGIVCPGVTIGENTVVGAGSVVTRSLPANVLAVGNPCRVVRPL